MSNFLQVDPEKMVREVFPKAKARTQAFNFWIDDGNGCKLGDFSRSLKGAWLSAFAELIPHFEAQAKMCDPNGSCDE